MKKLLSREEELKNIFRYKWSPCDPMYYRSNLFIHTKRVTWIASEIAKFLNNVTAKKIDVWFVQEMANFHDDDEIIMWDYLAMDKEVFSPEQKKQYEFDSNNAIEILYIHYWNIWNNYDYKDILLKLRNKTWIEYLIVEFADKLDAHLEVSHELFAWNKMFSVVLSDWWLNVGPFDYTRNKLKKRLDNFSEYFSPHIDLSGSFLDLNSTFDENKCLKNSKLHKISNLWNTWYNLYDKWIDIHLKYGTQEDVNYLVNQLEFK